MRRFLLAIVLLGMVGWTVYEFALASDSSDNGQEMVSDDSESEEGFAADVKKHLKQLKRMKQKKKLQLKKRLVSKSETLLPTFN